MYRFWSECINVVEPTEETQVDKGNDGDTNTKGDDKKCGISSYSLSDDTDGWKQT